MARSRAMAWLPNLTEEIKALTERRILAHASKAVPSKADQIRIRFRGDFCYIDAEIEKGRPLLHMCRLLWTGNVDAWGLAFYTYSHEKYEPTFFQTGAMLGTPEDGFDIGAVYLQD